MQETVSCIVNASSCPLSIIIVGIGHADFELMETLDADDVKLVDASTGQEAYRDIVQFVVYNDHKDEGELAEDVLQEIPDQMDSFYRSAKFYAEIN